MDSVCKTASCFTHAPVLRKESSGLGRDWGLERKEVNQGSDVKTLW